MALTIDGINSVGRMAADNPWVPFLPALERGILKSPEELARPPENPIGVDIANGVIPNSNHAGVLELGKSIVGVDHVGVEVRGKQLLINPTSKKDVDKEGYINEEGVIILGSSDGRIKIAGFAIDTANNPWRFDRMRRPKTGRSLSKLAILLTGWNLPSEYEVDEMLDTNQLIASPRHKFF